MTYEVMKIPPSLQLVTSDVTQKLIERQEQVALSMGERWLLHPDNQVNKKEEL
jgi:hypothetical protein